MQLFNINSDKDNICDMRVHLYACLPTLELMRIIVVLIFIEAYVAYRHSVLILMSIDTVYICLTPII